jgi:cobalt-zinc-cadmium efflux system membrane fusion protein
VPERQAAMVRLNQSAEILVAAFPDRRFPARIFHLSDSLDPDMRTVLVRSVVENTERLLRPEMYATVHIHLGETDPLLAVPAESIHTVQGRTVVYVALGEGKYEQRAVEAGRTVDEMTEIKEGLVEGEQVVGRGSFLIKTEFLRASIEES